MRIRSSQIESCLTFALIGAVLMGLIMSPAMSIPAKACAMEQTHAGAACCAPSDSPCCCQPASAHDRQANPSRDKKTDDHDCPCHHLRMTNPVPLMFAGPAALSIMPQPRAIHRATDDTFHSGDWRLPIFHPPS